MKFTGLFAAFFATVVTASACAQSAPQPLNLKLPPDSAADESVSAVPAHATDGPSTAATSTTTDTPTLPAMPAPAGVQYDSPDSAPRNPEAAVRPRCDDATYGQAQVHGSTTVGVVGGKHVSGNYQDAVVNVSKAFGSCDNPTGGMSITVDVGRGNFNGRHHRRWR